MRRTSIRLIVVVLMLVAAPAGTAQDLLRHVRSLYESAEYEAALNLLDRYAHESRDEVYPDRDGVANEYRALCLLALNRTDEAESLLARVLVDNPFYVPSSRDPAPRFRVAMTKARNQAAPHIARRIYDEARAAFDRRRYHEATDALERLLRVVLQDGLDPDVVHGLSEITTVSRKLLEVSRHSPPVYMAGDPGVEPAVAIRQTVPDPSVITRRLTSPRSARLELIVDASGAVESAALSAPIHPDYDPVLLSAARSWTFRPARLGGRPVLWRTAVAIQLAPVTSQ